MKNRSFPYVLFSLRLRAARAQCQPLTIQTENGKQTVLERSDIESSPHVRVTTPGSDTSATFEGVALKAVLEKARVEFGHSLRGKRLASCLLVEAADGRRAIIALPEIDPDFTDKQIVLAFLQDGKPLDTKAGVPNRYPGREKNGSLGQASHEAENRGCPIRVSPSQSLLRSL